MKKANTCEAGASGAGGERVKSSISSKHHKKTMEETKKIEDDLMRVQSILEADIIDHIDKSKESSTVVESPTSSPLNDE
jgi:hypothetical protein